MRPSLPMLLTIACLAGALAGQPLTVRRVPAQPAAPDAIDQARALVCRALLVEEENPDKAIDMLRQAAGQRSPPAARAIIFEALGETLERSAALPDHDQTAAEAQGYYQRAIRLDPTRTTARERLATIEWNAGRPEAAVGILAAAAQPEAPLALLTGDILASQGQTVEALSAYRTAWSLDPTDEAAPWRLVANYDTLGKAWGTELGLALCEEFEQADMRQAASRGYEQILQSLKGTDDLGLIDRAIVGWARTEAERGSLSPRSATILAEGPDSPLASELHALLKSEGREAGALDAWLETPETRQVAGQVLLQLASAHRRAGDAETAARMLEFTLNHAPDSSEYDEGGVLADRPMVAPRAAGDLASLYSVAGKQQELDDLIMRLLGDKNALYFDGNAPAIQEYHAVLGLIFAERAQWGSGLRGAPYHLARAVEVAQRRAERDAVEYQPLPHLTQIYAQGLEEHGKKEEAARLYGDAAMGFMDLGHDAAARATIDRAMRIAPEPERTGRLRELELLLDEREDLSKRDPARIDAERGLDLPAVEPGSLDPRFVNRQRFSTLVTLGDKAERAGYREAAEYVRESALDLAENKPGPTAGEVEKLARQRPRTANDQAWLETVRKTPKDRLAPPGKRERKPPG